MPLSIIRPARFKATDEWEQKLKLKKNGEKTHFYRKLSFSKKPFGLGFGYLDFNVELKTEPRNDPYFFVTTRGTSILGEVRNVEISRATLQILCT